MADAVRTLAAERTNAAFNDVDRLLRRAGFEVRQPRRGSSHYVYTKGPKRVVIVKHGAQVKPPYVTAAVRALEDEVEGVE